MFLMSIEHALSTHSLKSVVTWSFLLRPVCNLPAVSPISSVNLLSTAV